MATDASNTDGEDINDFLKRIKELGDKRDREDEERTRKLEEDILQGRRERQARRAERARSISPPKTSPTASPSSVTDTFSPSKSQQLTDPPVNFSPPSRASPQSRSEIMDDTDGWFRDKPKAQELTQPRSPSPIKQSGSLGRSGTLSWQQRPSSRDSNSSRTRPLSSLAMENAAARAASTPPKHSPTEDAEMSRSQIAHSLGAKDPTWFRQTADRGIGSAAYRKKQEDAPSDSFSATGGMRLPGLSRDSTTEPDQPADSVSDYERSSSPSKYTQDTSINQGNRFPSISSINSAGLGAPMQPPKTHKPEPTNMEPPDSTATNRIAMSPSQNRIGAERPVSPTKGMGGFVQSAMLKRSDSVNKRWSAQPTVGLSRGDSIASNKSGMGGLGYGLDGPPSFSRERRPLSVGPGSSPDTSRPTSSHSTSTVTQDRKDDVQVMTDKADKASSATSKPDPAPRPLPPSTSSKSLPTHERSESRASQGVDSMPTSPSKTMDTRRWSPTKASWLESALNKPESPSIKSPPPQQPSWMHDIQKAKELKAEGQNEGSQSPKRHSKEIVTPSLLRSPPIGPHSQPLSISGLPEGFSSGLVRKDSPPKRSPKILEEKTHKPPPQLKDTPKSVQASSDRGLGTNSDPDLPKEEPAITVQDPVSKKTYKPDLEAAVVPESKILPKAKPQTPPKTDFRAGLKSRQQKFDNNANDEAEFKNVFGKLKRTQTRNYVAPDELKSNIMHGKAALNATGGPKKIARVDEFKDSILKKKEAMKAGGVTRIEAPAPRKPSSSVPEALAKRDTLGRSDSNASTAALKPDPGSRPSWKARTTSQEKPPLDVPKTAEKPQTLKWSERQAQAAASAQAQAKPILPNKKSVSVAEKANPSPTEKTQPQIMENVKVVAEPQSFVTAELTKVRSTGSSSSGSKLADRLNPALLNILSRVPSPRQKEVLGSAEDTPAPTSTSYSTQDGEGSGAALSHMTKARARGPKRRLPNAAKSAETSSPIDPKSEPGPSNVVATSEPTENAVRSSKPSPRPLADLINNNERMRPAATESRKATSLAKTQEDMVPDEVKSPPSTLASSKPKVAPKSPDLRKVSSPTFNTSEQATLIKSPPAIQEQKNVPASVDQAVKPQTPLSSRFPMWSASKNEEPASSPPSNTDASTPKGPRLPQKRSTNLAEKASSGRDLPKSASESLSPAFKPMLSIAVKEQLISPARSATAGRASSTSEVLSSFFDTPPSASAKAEVDPQILLLSDPSAEKIRTIRFQISSITGDGKTGSLPSDQEYILHSDQMYLTVHEFEASKKETEVYLWSGSQVSQPSVEDAQLFSRKLARDNSAKLIHLPLGKETSRFFSALGGIGVFRANSQTADSSFYMLRARRHLFHMSFDEVPFMPTSLCSGFCYIVSAKFGKLWLWKGKGAGADELGTARLIGMNLSLLGEIEEVNENEEPDSFFESFPGGKKSRDQVEISSVHWAMKGRNENYVTRLFKIDHSARPQSSGGGMGGGLGSLWGRRSSVSPSKAEPVTEVKPYCQSDLKDDAIYVLDAWFEIYVYVPSTPSSKSKKSPEFSTALHFAQEYSILAASLQDRPMMPTVRILLGGCSRDFRLCFRAWDGKDKEAEYTMGLNECLQALT